MRSLLSVVLVAAAWPVAAGAQSFDGRDWQVVCDNTRTCRAAGYSPDGDDNPVSLLFTRGAGAGSGIAGELQLGLLGPHSVHAKSVQVTISRKPAGTIRVDADNHAELPYALVATLLKAFMAGANVSFSSGKTAWRVSNDGVVDVLRKMDELQGRTGTRSALVAPGGASDAGVALPVAPPRVQLGRLAGAQPGDDALALRMVASIQSSESCPLLDDAAAQAEARVIHLDANRVLVTQPCWAAAYNTGQGYWIANLRPPFAAEAVTLEGTDLDASGTITSWNAARASADCGGIGRWSWNGYRYEQTYDAVTGLCRQVKSGGAWQLPLLVTELVSAN